MERLIIYHTIAFSLGFFLDLIVGDPYSIPHPIRWIGRMIGFLDKRLLGDIKNDSKQRNPKWERLKGTVLVIMVILITLLCVTLIIWGAYYLSAVSGIVVEAILTAYLLACKSLKDESMKVYRKLKDEDLNGARDAVSMIVGRDTDCLDEIGVTKATVETIAENASDGVIAPMIYACIGGPVLGFIYKAINTCDSMIGYHNDRYEYFGTAGARLDDVVNFVPSRICAWLMIVAASLSGRDFSASRGFKIFRRDRYNHKSPNSAQTESVCAGVLGVMLAGDASYFGKIVHKPTIGDDTRPIEVEDIVRTNKLLYTTAFLGYGLGICFLLLALFLFSQS